MLQNYISKITTISLSGYNELTWLEMLNAVVQTPVLSPMTTGTILMPGILSNVVAISMIGSFYLWHVATPYISHNSPLWSPLRSMLGKMNKFHLPKHSWHINNDGVQRHCTSRRNLIKPISYIPWNLLHRVVFVCVWKLMRQPVAASNAISLAWLNSPCNTENRFKNHQPQWVD